jgi:hypothetical protein
MTTGALARAAVAVYPPAWRARYGDEVRALIEDGTADMRAAGRLREVGSLAWHGVLAWLRPAGHLHDRPARMRASLGTVLVAWVVLAGLGMVFVQLTQGQRTLQGATTADHPAIRWAYLVFDVAAAVSVLAVTVGGLPLWYRMMRTAYREHRRREVAYLLLPIVVPAAFVAVASAVVLLVRRPGALVYPGVNSVVELANGNVGVGWFTALVVLGFAAAGTAAAGPVLALRRLRPEGPTLRWAVRAAVVAASSMGVAAVAGVAAMIGLYRWAPPFSGYHHTGPLGAYGLAVVFSAAVALVSATRGLRAVAR